MSRSNRSTFFASQEPHSKVKAEIVAEYAPKWAKVILSRWPRILYLDMFAGPGLYDDGSLSTPMLVLPQIIEDTKLRSGVSTWFSDENKDAVDRLRKNVAGIPNISMLAEEPKIQVQTVDEAVRNELAGIKMIPTFAFLDPWGYKGFSTDLVKSIVKDLGSECVFFFNYNRINPGVGNPSVSRHMAAIFGHEGSVRLRDRVRLAQPREREDAIKSALAEALQFDDRELYILPFRFVRRGKTLHFLVFVGKHFLGFDIMRHIMANRSSSSTQGVPSFEYAEGNDPQVELFETPLDDLRQSIHEDMAGRAPITFKKLYETHSRNRLCIRANYRAAILDLEKSGAVKLTFLRSRKPHELPDSTTLEFH